MKFLLSIGVLLSSLFSIGQTSLSLKPNAALGKDASVWSNGPNNNYANAAAINVYTWTNSGALGIKRAYLIFDLSSIPNQAVIDSAFLNLFYDPMTNEGFTTHSGVTNLEVKRVTSAWSEPSITWNNQPNASTLNQVNVPAHTSSTQNYKINVTQLVTDMRTNGNTNYGFQIKMQDEVNYYRGILIASSDHSDSTLRPELNVFYNITTGISKNDDQFSKALNIYPNPSNDIFKLGFSNNLLLSDFQIQLFDMLGNELKVKPVNSQINLSDQSAGIYFLKLTDAKGGSFSKKIILN